MIKVNLYSGVGRKTVVKSLVKEAKEKCDQLPKKLKPLFLLQLAQTLINYDNIGIKILKKIEESTKDLTLLPGTKNILNFQVFSCFLQAENLTTDDLNEMEYFARKLPLESTEISDYKNDMVEDLKNDTIEIIGESHYSDDIIENAQILNFLLSNKPIEVSQKFALFLVATKYFHNDETIEALRILSELISTTEDTLTISFIDQINVKDEINKLIKTIFKNMLNDDNFEMCYKILDSGLIQNEEKKAKFERLLRNALISKVQNTETRLTKLKDILAKEKLSSEMRNDMFSAGESIMKIRVNIIERELKQLHNKTKNYYRSLSVFIGGVVLFGAWMMSQKMRDFGLT